MTEEKYMRFEAIGPNDDESDFVLVHHGVKGMKWGVRRQKIKAVKAQHRAKDQAAVNKVTAAENHAWNVYKKHYDANRAKGMGRHQAYKAASNHPEVKRADAHFNKLDSQLSGVAKQNKQAAKQQIKDIKGQSQTRQIKDARKRMLAARSQEFKSASSVGAKASIALLGELSPHLSHEYLANPDRQTALRMTKGEKAAHAALAVATGGTSLLGTGTAAAVYGASRARKG